MTMPAYYIPHGGGPCFFMEWNPPDAWDRMRAFLDGIDAALPARPSTIVVFSAHWEEHEVVVSGGERPDLIYDYYGFPPHTYQLAYDAPGDPTLARRICTLLTDAGIPSRVDDEAGWDHGVFIPLKVMYPEADIPVVSVSLRAGLDPEQHLAIGRALAPLRDEDVLLVGSGMSYHNLRNFSPPDSQRFDAWLDRAFAATGEERDEALRSWEAAPSARTAHPREEHLIPGFVVAGAADPTRPARKVYTDTPMGGATVSGWAFD